MMILGLSTPISAKRWWQQLARVVLVALQVMFGTLRETHLTRVFSDHIAS